MKYLRYEGTFDGNDARWTIQLWQEADEPFEVQDLDFPTSPLTVEWLTTARHEPLCASMATLILISPGDRTYIDLYTENPRGVMLVVKRNGVEWWRGYLDTETYEEPYDRVNNYDVELTFYDFGNLSRESFAGVGVKSVAAIISDCLAVSPLAGLTIDYSLAALTIDDSLIDDNPLDHIIVNAANFYDEDGEAMTLSDVLSEILQPLGLKIMQRGGRVWVFDLMGLKSQEALPISWQGTDQRLGVDRVYNKVTLTWSPYAQSVELDREPWSSKPVGGSDDLYYREQEVGEYHRRNYLYDTSDAHIVGQTVEGMSSPNFYPTDYLGFQLWTRAEEDEAGCYEQKSADVPVFKIVPGYSGEEASGFVGTQLTTNYFLDKYNYSLPVSCAGPIALANYRSPLNPGETPLLVTTPIELPSVGDPGSLQIKVSVGLLYSHLINPFEDPTGTKYANGSKESQIYKDYKKKYNYIYMPVVIKFVPDNGGGAMYWSNLTHLKNPPEPWGYKSTMGIWLPTPTAAYLAWYNADGAKDNAAISSGFAVNRQAIAPNREDDYIPKGIAKGETGQFIPYPSASSGRLSVMVLRNGWRTCKQGQALQTGLIVDNEHSVALSWNLFKCPKIEVVSNSPTARDLPSSDVKFEATLNANAAEELSVETIIGTATDRAPAGRGVLMCRTYKLMNMADNLKRGNHTGTMEDLLLRSLISQYAERSAVLTGESNYSPFGLHPYTDLAMPGVTFIAAAQTVNTEEGTAETTYIEIKDEDYEQEI